MKNKVNIPGVGFVALDRDRLWRFMSRRVKCTLCDSAGVIRSGMIQSIQMEDGSGLSFNVSMYDTLKRTVVFHIRTTE